MNSGPTSRRLLTKSQKFRVRHCRPYVGCREGRRVTHIARRVRRVLSHVRKNPRRGSQTDDANHNQNQSVTHLPATQLIPPADQQHNTSAHRVEGGYFQEDCEGNCFHSIVFIQSSSLDCLLVVYQLPAACGGLCDLFQLQYRLVQRNADCDPMLVKQSGIPSKIIAFLRRQFRHERRQLVNEFLCLRM